VPVPEGSIHKYFIIFFLLFGSLAGSSNTNKVQQEIKIQERKV
jgi:hypothetical protein